MSTHFFKKVHRATTDKRFYQEVAHDSFWQRARYLFILLWITGVVSTVYMSISAWKWIHAEMPTVFTEISYELDHLYPSDLIVTIEKGVLKTNQENPVMYKPRFVKNDTTDPYALVLDPKGTVTIDTCKCMALVSAMGVSVHTDRKVEYRTFEQMGIKSDKPVTIDKAGYDSLKKVVAPYIANGMTYLEKLIYVASGLLVLVIPVILTASWLMTLIFWSLFGWITSKIIKRPISYGETYLLSMYLITPLILIDTVSTFVAAPLLTGPMRFILYIILVAIFVPASVTKVSHHE
ncbi:MAG: DUF1189 family protein [bacterium]